MIGLHPRRGEPWTVAEDQHLRRLLREARRRWPKASRTGYRRPSHAIYAAEQLGRTTEAIIARMYVLTAIDAHRQSDQAKAAR